jgi:hypothetical protein
MHKRSVCGGAHSMKCVTHCILQLSGPKTKVQNMLPSELKLHALKFQVKCEINFNSLISYSKKRHKLLGALSELSLGVMLMTYPW